MTDLYHLAYISKNEMPGTKEEVQQQVEKILAIAHENNPKRGVTGALLYSGGYFCQEIEGPQEALEDLFELIQMDPRHGNLTVLHFEPLEERNFSDWSMAFAGIEDDMRYDVEGIKASKDELVMKEAGKSLVATLDNMVDQHQKILANA